MRLVRSAAAIFAAGISMFWAAAASAEHMTGAYTGTGDGAGVLLQLTETGTALTGVFTGEALGTLTAETDGGNNATGILFINGDTKARFSSTWAADGLTLFIEQQGGGEQTVFFALNGAAPPVPPTAPTPPTKPGVTVPPAPPPVNVTPPVPPTPPVADIGNLDALLGAIRTLVAEMMATRTDVHRAAVVQCLFTVTADLPPAERQALTDAGFNPNADLIARLEQLMPGISQRVAACYDAPEPTVPPASAAAAPVLDEATVNTALNLAIIAFVDDELDGAPADVRTVAIECLTGVVIDLPIEERQILAERDFDPNAEQIDRLEILKPGIVDMVEACLAGEEEMGEAELHEALRDQIAAAVARMFNDANATQQAAMVACLAVAYEVLTLADVQLMVETQLTPPVDQRQRMTAEYPGLGAAVAACTLPPPRAP